MTDKKYILAYTRKSKEDIIYAEKLAYSMHLAYSDDGENYQALNHNSGVLFAKATDNEDKTMNAKSLKCPYIFHMKDGSFGVLAIRTEANGDKDSESKGKVLFFTSDDLLQYKEVGLIDLGTDEYIEGVRCEFDKDKGFYRLFWQGKDSAWNYSEVKDFHDLVSGSEKVIREVAEESIKIEEVTTDIEGIVPGNVIAVDGDIALRLKLRLCSPYHVSTEIPEEVRVSSLEELDKVKVKAIYNDGTSSMKTLDWDADDIDWDKKGTYEITASIHQDHYEFPIALNRADPCIGRWKGKYYFIATNDADNNKTIYIREGDTIPELLDAQEHLILDTNTYDHIGGLLWAPELHVVEDELYIFHAATPGEFFEEECHVMKLKENGDPTKKEDWTMPRRVLKKDGSYLCEAGKVISLDMTCFKWEGEYYVSWSQRQFLPVDIGAWLYIAKIDPKKPWQLTTDPVLLSKPDYGWANNHTFVDEGSYALITDEKIFLTFSSAAVDATYVVALLTAEPGSDLLDPDCWVKSNYPLLTSRSVPGEYGPGHNSYVIDDNGDVWNAYHARPGVEGPRSSGIRRVHFDIDGYPVLDLTEERDVNPDLKDIKTKLIIE